MLFRLIRALYNDQRVRFICIGGFATLIDSGLYALLVKWQQMAPTLAVTCSFAVAFVFSFFAQRHVTFRAAGTGMGDGLRQFFRFLSVQVIGLGLSIGTVQAVKMAGVDPLWAILPKIFVIPFITYILARSWAFRPEMSEIP